MNEFYTVFKVPDSGNMESRHRSLYASDLVLCCKTDYSKNVSCVVKQIALRTRPMLQDPDRSMSKILFYVVRPISLYASELVL